MFADGLGEMWESLSSARAVRRVFMIPYMGMWGAVLHPELARVVSIQVVWIASLQHGIRIRAWQIVASTRGTGEALSPLQTQANIFAVRALHYAIETLTQEDITNIAVAHHGKLHRF